MLWLTFTSVLLAFLSILTECLTKSTSWMEGSILAEFEGKAHNYLEVTMSRA